MKRNKMIFVYGLIMLVCVALIAVIGLATGPSVHHDSEKGQNAIDEKQNSIRLLEERVAELEKENAALNEEVKKVTEERDALLEESKKIDTSGSEAVTLEQAMSDLKDIYENYKAGNVAEAKGAFEKIEPMGFDDATLAYYEILKDVLGN